MVDETWFSSASLNKIGENLVGGISAKRAPVGSANWSLKAETQNVMGDIKDALYSLGYRFAVMQHFKVS